MMTLLAPGALICLTLLAIPIVVHLFKPRKVRQTPFSSLRWLHLTQQRMARRIQWHQVLLFLLRAALLTLLVLALARPLFSPHGTAGSLDQVVVLDVSRSMGRRLEGRPRPLDTARDLAAQLLRRMQPGDRTALLLSGAKTSVLAPWITDGAPYLPTLQSLEPGPTATNLDSALPMLRSLLAQRRPGAKVEVYILTDNASGSWTPGAIASFTADLPQQFEPAFHVVDVGLPAPRNGWLAAARVRETPSGPALHVEAACVGNPPQNRMLFVAGLSGKQEISAKISLSADRPTAIDLPLPNVAQRSPSDRNRGGRRAAAAAYLRLRLDPPDEMPDDDEFFVDLDLARAARVLLVEPDAAADETQRPGFALRTALAALAEAGAEADYNVAVRSPAAASDAEIASAEIVLLADVPGLTAAQAAALMRRLHAGAGAAVFLGPGVQPDVYNQRFLDRLHPAEGLLPAALGSVVTAPAGRGGLAEWGHWDPRHPLLAGLLDPLLGDLAQTRSRSYLRFAGPPASADETLAAFDDGAPALIARRVGAGRVVWINASADDRWCDLPRRKSFVPLVDRLLKYLSGAGRQRTFASGEPVALRLPDGMARAVVRTPSGTAIESVVESVESGAYLRLDGLTEPGVYTVEPLPQDAATGEKPSGTTTAGTAPLSFVVQPSRAESALTPLDAVTLRAWWRPAKLELLKPSALQAALRAGGGRIALEPWLVLAAGLVLLAESFLVHWLCPRINPALAASPVRRRGFVAPLRSRENVPS